MLANLIRLTVCSVYYPAVAIAFLHIIARQLLSFFETAGVFGSSAMVEELQRRH